MRRDAHAPLNQVGVVLEILRVHAMQGHEQPYALEEVDRCPRAVADHEAGIIDVAQ